MKKILAILALVLTISGCTLFSPTKDVDSLTGILSKQDANDTYQGTHLLMEEDGVENPLSSTALNLSSPQYLGNKVTVQGGVDKETGVFGVTGVTVLEVLEKEEGAVKWVEYMNQEMGFKWKYYDNWAVSEIKKETRDLFEIYELAFALNKDSVIVNRFVNPGEHGDVPDYWTKNFTADINDYSVSEVKIGANQNSAKEYQYGKEVHYTLKRDKDLYAISFIPSDGSTENDNIFKEMLAEFQFVPFASVEAGVGTEAGADETIPAEDAIAAPDDGIPEVYGWEGVTAEESYDYSDYSEFESLPYKFKAKYPSDWYYSGTTGTGDVLHRYDFSDQPVTDTNIFASLEVLSSDSQPSGQKRQVLNGSGFATVKYQGDEVYFYLKIGDRVYSVHGKKELESSLEMVLDSITEVKSEE